jgi:hypothetical protein
LQTFFARAASSCHTHIVLRQLEQQTNKRRSTKTKNVARCSIAMLTEQLLKKREIAEKLLVCLVAFQLLLA